MSSLIESFRSATSVGKTVVETVTKTVSRCTASVLDSYELGGRKITEITNSYLHRIPARIVQELYWTGPTMIAFLSIPRFWCDWIAKPISLLQPTSLFLSNAIGHENTCRFYAGVRNVCLVHAAVDSFALAATGNLWMILPLAQNLTTALFAHAETVRPKPL